MKKLSKLSLLDLKGKCKVINENELPDFIGGSNISQFEIGCLMHYVQGNGTTLPMNESQWNSIRVYAENQYSSGGYSNGEWVCLNGNNYFKAEVSFYGNSQYDQGLGTATLYFDSCGTAIGIKDTYDFNGLPEGERSEYNEILTTLGSYIPGNQYSINYGVWD